MEKEMKIKKLENKLNILYDKYIPLHTLYGEEDVRVLALKPSLQMYALSNYYINNFYNIDETIDKVIYTLLDLIEQCENINIFENTKHSLFSRLKQKRKIKIQRKKYKEIFLILSTFYRSTKSTFIYPTKIKVDKYKELIDLADKLIIEEIQRRNNTQETLSNNDEIELL